VEIVFLYPWAVAFDASPFLRSSRVLFIYDSGGRAIYAWRKGVLEWASVALFENTRLMEISFSLFFASEEDHDL
jgi:hypothetical protein